MVSTNFKYQVFAQNGAERLLKCVKFGMQKSVDIYNEVLNRNESLDFKVRDFSEINYNPEIMHIKNPHMKISLIYIKMQKELSQSNSYLIFLINRFRDEYLNHEYLGHTNVFPANEGQKQNVLITLNLFINESLKNKDFNFISTFLGFHEQMHAITDAAERNGMEHCTNLGCGLADMSTPGWDADTHIKNMSYTFSREKRFEICSYCRGLVEQSFNLMQ
ncbi:Uncharacterised protein [Candidatus Tiddalikarchaeum anstoanum]|nr:Uncharacterised protein [Candidatus Tiddalikarchaeum anstoanum]